MGPLSATALVVRVQGDVQRPDQSVAVMRFEPFPRGGQCTVDLAVHLLRRLQTGGVRNTSTTRRSCGFLSLATSPRRSARSTRPDRVDLSRPRNAASSVMRGRRSRSTPRSRSWVRDEVALGSDAGEHAHHLKGAADQGVHEGIGSRGATLRALPAARAPGRAWGPARRFTALVRNAPGFPRRGVRDRSGRLPRWLTGLLEGRVEHRS
ncbi:hypothetical protein AMK24_23490 [Streptomyces sp. CB02366]|nr:hypothetical protein AMK24_23490 [Streptomyces sp. CB02366]